MLETKQMNELELEDLLLLLFMRQNMTLLRPEYISFRFAETLKRTLD